MAYEQHIHAAADSGVIARCAVITLSDTRDELMDTSGRSIRTMLEQNADYHAGAVYTAYLVASFDTVYRLAPKLSDLVAAPYDAIAARDLIETIPAIELPTAIAFLEFLKQRAAEQVAKSAGEHDPTDARDDVP